MSLIDPAAVSKPAPGAASAEAEFRINSVGLAQPWESLLATHPLANIFCSWGWGEYKRNTGWTVERLRIDDAKGRIFALCPVSAKRKFGCRLVHIQGAPLVFDCDDPERVARMLRALLGHLRLGPFDMVAIHTYGFRTNAAILGLLATGFTPVLNRSNYTLMLDLTRGVDEVRSSLSRRWKRSLRSAEQEFKLVTRFCDDPTARRQALQRFEPMYRDLAMRRRFHSGTNIGEFAKVVAEDPRWVVLEVLDGDRVLAIRIAHIAGDLITDFLAATSEDAVHSNAGYQAMWSLVEHAIGRGLARLNCGGIDPFNLPGLFLFKRGLSNDLAQSDPLWLFSRSRLARNATQLYLTWS